MDIRRLETLVARQMMGPDDALHILSEKLINLIEEGIKVGVTLGQMIDHAEAVLDDGEVIE